MISCSSAGSVQVGFDSTNWNTSESMVNSIVSTRTNSLERSNWRTPASHTTDSSASHRVPGGLDLVPFTDFHNILYVSPKSLNLAVKHNFSRVSCLLFPPILTLSMFCNPVSKTHCQVGFTINLSMLSERTLLDWIPVSSLLRTVRLNRSVRFNSSRWKCHYLFIISVCMPTGYSSPETKEKFYWELSIWLRSALPTDVMVLVDDFSARGRQNSTSQADFLSRSIASTPVIASSNSRNPCLLLGLFLLSSIVYPCLPV